MAFHLISLLFQAVLIGQHFIVIGHEDGVYILDVSRSVVKIRAMLLFAHRLSAKVALSCTQQMCRLF